MPEELQKICAVNKNAPFCQGLTDISDAVVGASRPEAHAGSYRIERKGSLVILDGSASSDKDNDIQKFLWIQKSGTPVTLSSRDQKQSSFIAPDDDPGPELLIFELAVTDSRGESDTDTCIIELW